MTAASYVDLGGQRVTKARLTAPYYGTWVADLELATSSVVPTITTLTIGNLSLACSVYRQGTFAGITSARVVGGAGGWRKSVPAQGYYSASGIMMSTLLRDAAGAVGEKVTVISDVLVGNAWMREAGPAARLLRQLAGAEWWVDQTGTTQVGSRPTTPVTSSFQVTAWHGDRGWYDVATEDVASWLPGASFSSVLIPAPVTVGLTELIVDNKGKLRLSVLSTT